MSIFLFVSLLNFSLAIPSPLYPDYPEYYGKYSSLLLSKCMALWDLLDVFHVRFAPISRFNCQTCISGLLLPHILVVSQDYVLPWLDSSKHSRPTLFEELVSIYAVVIVWLVFNISPICSPTPSIMDRICYVASTMKTLFSKV